MPYEPTLASLRQHPVPDWYHDAKFGIFIHWGVFSIPAYAPRSSLDFNQALAQKGDRWWFANTTYTEWYLNSLRIPGSPVARYHAETYGPGRSYFEFAPQFKAASREWDPQDWSALFQEAGARYTILVAKHHDGFLLWPSRTPNPCIPGYGSDRDIVGELAEAVRDRGLRFGVYYSSALDWSFTKAPVEDIAGLFSRGIPADPRYAEYQLGHWRELIDRCQPSILWGDIAYPPGGRLYELLAEYYNHVEAGVVNDRWVRFPTWLQRFARTPPGRALINRTIRRAIARDGADNPQPPHCDFTTPEFRSYPEIRSKKWETCRGMGNGFGYNRMELDEDYLQLPELIRLLVDIVSKNGNLLLNVGPMADGTIPEVQRHLLQGLGAWLQVYGEGIYGTRPWTRAEGRVTGGGQVRFTQKNGTLYAFLLDTPPGPEVVIQDLHVADNARILDLGSRRPLPFHQEGADLRLILPGPPPGPLAWGIAIQG